MTQLELAAMPVAERLRLMEDLWDSLSAGGEAVPAWHRNVLAARAERLDKGVEAISDWHDAKLRLRDKATGQ